MTRPIADPLCTIGHIKIIIIVKRYCKLVLIFAIKIIDIENGGRDDQLKSSSEKTLN